MKSKRFFSFFFLTAAPLYALSQQPQLIVQIVIDQLRGDLIYQHQSQFGNSGFNFLLNHGLNFSNAHHPHANTTTCAGHTTIATGSYPALHGIINNEWYDRTTRQLMYCMEDLTSQPLPSNHTQILTPGRSAKNITATTLSDELILSKKGKAFGVSFKDRSAIALAGHAGKAFWFDKFNGGFITTDYYYSTYPQWVNDWNNLYKPQSISWKLERAQKDYLNANTPVFPQYIKEFGITFPHIIKQKPASSYFKLLCKTPVADQLTVDFAEHLLAAEHLGKTTNQTDYLGISFSATDAIGHQFGPNSLEAEDNLLQLDKTLARLIKTLDKEVGLDKVLIVLTADHGVPDNPAYLAKHHLKEVPPLNETEVRRKIITKLQQYYQLPKETLVSIIPPYVYLDQNIINKHRLDSALVSFTVAELLNKQEGIYRAYPLPVNRYPNDWISDKVNRMAYPNRTGDVYLVFAPFQSRGELSDERLVHGSPWQYDSYVPLLFVNPQFKPMSIARPVYTTDIAPTLSALLRIKYPSASVGTPLREVLKNYTDNS